MTETMPFPALRRLAVTSPEVLRSLPCSLGAGLGSRYVEATADRRRAGNPRSLVALDSGGGLAGWQAIRWLDRGTGHLVEVTTDPNEPNAVLLSTLDDKAVEWSHPPRYGPVESVVVDPDFVRIVGRVRGCWTLTWRVSQGISSPAGRCTRTTASDASRRCGPVPMRSGPNGSRHVPGCR
jgi:hypothetical protein